ncbi:hypothetical protein GUITHDRAFT_63812 [Guillardia theta CCMP2712]|uniref:Uncharacterized protein n=1 Tax=Guillardia theta (strain CCMP2712) TaxID=905079 RepID=L1K0N3_GUITC|nr:hypothetical protein GUITHDRAFT_63812 [Guillardia theta CCMP2712]EKX54172.1 hypothetical protein GUITHDRAFT_63812 [Guillardia theta CCMP2712]|eukprot:XP_005841152.1 hypothetical protein GUITHDRAFT_63812 [Guillardia theta CCMP2712]
MTKSKNVFLITGGYDHSIKLWDVHNGACARTLQFPDSHINLLRVSPNKKWLAVAAHPLIRIYKTDFASNGHLSELMGHTKNVTSVVFDSFGTGLYSCGEDCLVKFWDLRQGKSVIDFSHAAPCSSLALHPCQHIVVSGDNDGHIRIWDVRARKCLREMVPEAEVGIRSCSITPDSSMLVAANNNGTCFVWRLDPERKTTCDLSLEPLVQIDAHKTFILRTAVSSNSKYMATGAGDNTAKIWSLPSFEHVHTLSAHQRWVWDVEFSGDSNFLFTGSSDNSARSWNVAQGEAICSFNGHHKVTGLCQC